MAILIQRMIGAAVKKDSSGYGLGVIIAAVVSLIVLTLVFSVLKKIVVRAAAARRTYSHYKNRDDVEKNDALILNAVDSGDKRQYRKQLKKGKKIKDSAGAWGVVDRVLGAVFGGVNLLLGVGLVIVAILLFADMSQIKFLSDAFSSALTSSGWNSLGVKFALDLPLIAILSLAIRAGFRGGISSFLCIFVVLGMVVGFGFAAYSIAASDMCAGAVEGLKNGLLSGVSGSLGGAADTIAKVVLAAIIFLLSLVFVIVIAIFLPKLVDRFRDNKVFSSIDGVLGAILFTGVLLALMIVVGGVAYTLNDLQFMEKLNEYNKYSHFADAIYSGNPLGDTFKNLPIRGWFGK